MINMIEKSEMDFFGNLVSSYDCPTTVWTVSKPGSGKDSIMAVIKTALDMGAVVDLDTDGFIGHSYEHGIKKIEDADMFVCQWAKSRWKGYRTLYICAKCECK